MRAQIARGGVFNPGKWVRRRTVAREYLGSKVLVLPDRPRANSAFQ